MASSSKTTTNHHGTFVLTRGKAASEFTCGRCRKPKVAKITVEWTQPGAAEPTVICNGCYGYLQSDKA